jgi:enolase
MAKIIKLKARQVFDSRGYPTVEAEILLEKNSLGRFICPSGASTGSKEALELRDHEAWFMGKGVLKAVSHINQEIANNILGRSFKDQEELDKFLIDLDGTENKSRLGANAILPVSGAFFHAIAAYEKRALYDQGQEIFILPRPMVNVLNGGVHADNNLDIQEFMLVPKAKTFSEAMRMVAESFYALKSILKSRGLSTAVGDEGGFAPKLKSNEEALDLLSKAVQMAGFALHKDLSFALDIAANELHVNNKYKLNNKYLDQEELLNWYEKISLQYPICSIEDPFSENDFLGFSKIVKSLGSKIQIIGDDLFVTNEKYLSLGIKNNYANGILIKINQVGTISETIKAIKLAKDHKFFTIISHRSGDSEDTTIADLAVLTSAGQIKTGSLARSERVCKYNRLLKIEEELGDKACLWQG